LRLVFVGAVEGSAIALRALVAAGMVPRLTVTLPAEASHRHSDIADLSGIARAAGGEVHLTTNINAQATIEAIRGVQPDLCLVIGWSQICREPFRSIARLGNVGFHPAALPRMRGRAVIPWTILADEKVTGSSLFWLDEGVDSGDILIQRTFPVAPDETARSLYRKHTTNLGEMIVQAVSRVSTGEMPRSPQDHSLATYCAKRTQADGAIDWRSPAKAILRLVRAVGDPYPGAFTLGGDGEVTIDSAIPFAPSWRYVGMPGQVQAVTTSGFVVRCGDGECIEVTGWRSPSGRSPKLHSRFQDKTS
jgi:methionyl-tRNA formyltransferase